MHERLAWSVKVFGHLLISLCVSFPPIDQAAGGSLSLIAVLRDVALGF